MIDLLDLVRSIAAAAERAAERKNYPAPCSQGSPLLGSVRQACVERGYTAGGLAVPGVTAIASHVVADGQVDWIMCERISNEDHVDEALRNFSCDPTQDNASGLIQAALTAFLADTAAAAAQMVADALSVVHSFLLGEGTLDGLHFGDTDTAKPRPAYWWRHHLRAALAAAPVQAQEPVDLLLFCPACHTQHIDAAEEAEVFDTGNGTQYEMNPDRWDNPPHRSHLCHECGHVWRPADVPTNGVASIKTNGPKDSAPVQPVAVQDDAVLKAAQALLDEHRAACLTDPMHALIEMAEDDEEANVSAVLLANLFRAISTTVPAAPIAAPPAGLVFMNDGAEPDYSKLDCPACGGSGHAGDVPAGSVP